MKNEKKLATIGQAATAILKAMQANNVTFEELQDILKALTERKRKENELK